jgi:hypothetical protein
VVDPWKLPTVGDATRLFKIAFEKGGETLEVGTNGCMKGIGAAKPNAEPSVVRLSNYGADKILFDV